MVWKNEENDLPKLCISMHKLIGLKLVIYIFTITHNHMKDFNAHLSLPKLLSKQSFLKKTLIKLCYSHTN